ncbi:MAG TPA: mechanosensitive ion channel domain-containing protein [Vicinamibacteria bacterium]|nr:mechanosensitive ion channel domain-containing protein [Vicinamibacteria bacterium]
MRMLARPEIWIALAAVVIGVGGALLLRLLALRHAARRQSRVAAAFARRTIPPLLLLLPVLLGRLAQPLLDLQPAVAPTVRHAGDLLLIATFGWLLISLIGVLDDRLHERVLTGEGQDARARSLLTRVSILDRLLTSVIVVLTIAGMLVTFPEVRAVGTSILASAGIAGVLLGFAARPAAENLIAGLQIALTEPFHIDDVVIVEGEWGKVEEVTSTYVVVRIWDRRRLVLPLRYFIEKPFQNWTRRGADLLGQVTLEVDYRTPVEEVRRQAGEIVAGSEHWDREFWNLQVTEAGERTMRLRILASARDADRAWDLRCEVRERLIAYLQQQHPEALPRVRASVEGASSGAA